MCAMDRMEQEKRSFDLCLEADTEDTDINFLNVNGDLSVSFQRRTNPTDGFYVVFPLLLTPDPFIS